MNEWTKAVMGHYWFPGFYVMTALALVCSLLIVADIIRPSQGLPDTCRYECSGKVRSSSLTAGEGLVCECVVEP